MIQQVDIALVGVLENDEIDCPPLRVLADWRRQGLRCALLTIVDIDGKSPRSIGAQMVVNETGAMHGYLTGGCLEKELALVALDTITKGHNVLHRYGKDSPFIDMKLPCGSGIDIYFDQAIEDVIVHEAVALMDSRQPFGLITQLETGHSRIKAYDARKPVPNQMGSRDTHFEKMVQPQLHLNIYGAGFSAIQLAFLAKAAGIGLSFFAGDDITISGTKTMGLDVHDLRDGTFKIPPSDMWTGSMLIFHEHEREIPILRRLVEEPGFYIGAIGSRDVAASRVQALKDVGASGAQIDRITMPAGLVRAARNATEIAIGVLAEILDRARRDGLVA